MNIPVFAPSLDGNELAYVQDCIKSGWISSEGPYVRRFEEEFAAKHGRKHGISVTNGTAALETAVVALKLGEGDEVIMPTFTIISCALAVIRAGALPVLVDCDPVTWNMDVSQIEARITPRTKAIMPVHIYGLPVEMDAVRKLADKHGLIIIEDTAEAIGLSYKGRLCGSFGTLSTFSFYANKHVTTGEGGMILTDDDDLAERCRSLRNLCFQPHKRFVHEEMGWNMRMSNLQAALGVAQLEKLERTIARKRELGALYHKHLAGFDKVQLPLDTTSYAENVYWVWGVVLADSVAQDAVETAKRLAAAGIGTRPFFWCLHEQPVFRNMGLFEGEKHPHSERIARRGLYLPTGTALGESEVRYVTDKLREALA